MGIHVHRYYCQGHLLQISVFKQKDTNCDKNNCCNEQTELIRNKTPYTFNHFDASLSTPDKYVLIKENVSLVETVIQQFFSSHTIIKPPPVRTQVKLAKMQAYLL